MNKIIKKPTTRDAFESIYFDYFYPDTNSNTPWALSQDFYNQSIPCMKLEEQFVDSVAKSAEMPFDIDKSIQGVKLKQNPLGELFYGLLIKQNENTLNPGQFNSNLCFKIRNCDHHAQYRYEVSENSKALSAVASSLGLNCVNFTRHPLSKINIEGALEGELINTFVTCLRKATKQKNFKAKVDKRKKESTQSFTRYINRLYANNPYLFGVRIVICYQGEYANSITLEDSASHFMKYLETFETDTDLGSPVGWWWKREYSTEVSYRYYLILFFDSRKTCYDPMMIQGIYGRHWRYVSNERGMYFDPIVMERDYQRCGSELPQQGYAETKELFVSSIQRMLKRDIYLRLERSPKFEHFGMGKLPKLAVDSPSNNGPIQSIPNRF